MVFINFVLWMILVVLFFQTFLIGFTMDSVRSIEKIIKEYIEEKEDT